MRAFMMILIAISVTALTLPEVVDFPSKLVFNGSESAPIGFYWIDRKEAKKGDFVLVRVPESVKEMVSDRGYLPNKIPLIKRIAASNGDTVCRRKKEILIDGITVAVAQDKDHLGRKMPVWRGCHLLIQRRVFLLQEHPNSFDGRYFGPVSTNLIIGRATHLRFPWRRRNPT